MNLDPTQQAAAETDAKRVLCLAGPGSGKTRTLIERIRYMVEGQSVTPSRIVSITFTRAAAREMKDRLPESCRGVNISTLHAFGLRLIMEYGGELGYEPHWLTIAPDEDVMLDEREVLCDLNIIRKKSDGTWSWVRCRKKDWDTFRDGITSASIENPEDSSPVLWKAWNALMARLRSENVLTYGGILYEAHRLLQDRKALKDYRKRFRHYLIDEVQDTDHMQWRILWRLVEAADPLTLFAVGDADQSIYRWRNSTPALMIDYAHRADTTLYKLEKCYRFGGQIADACNSLIRHNQERIPKDIIPAEGLTGELYLHAQHTIEDVRDMVQMAMASGARPGEIAVLCRQHKPLETLKELLVNAECPVIKLGRLNALRGTSEFRAVMGYVRLAVNVRDWSAFMGVAASEGLSQPEINALREKALAHHISVAEAYRPHAEWPSSLPAIRAHLAARDPHGDYSEALDYLQYFKSRRGCASLQELVFQVGMASMQDERKEGEDKVTLCTCHAAKGCEWPVVFVIAMNEGVFPSRRSENEGRIEEERCLAYVAISRAERVCHLVHTREPDEVVPREVSRFVREASGQQGGDK